MSADPPEALKRKWPALAARIAARLARARERFDDTAAFLNPHQPNDYDAGKDAHDSYFAAIEAKRLRGDARRLLVRECPFCATPLRRVVSKARSFDPPRDYIEWRHDTPSGPCYLFARLGPVISSTRDDAVAEHIFLDAWNTRSQPL